MTVDFNKLIPDLHLWNDGAGIDVGGWLSSMGNFELAIAFCELFWPEFMELDGCVFRAGTQEEYYRIWLKTLKGNKTSVEAMINHMHILDCFANPEKEPIKEQVIHLGRKLQEIWAAKLARDFPDKEFVVSFPEDDVQDLLDYEITFFQPREEGLEPEC